jgi:hypothetical protein
MDIDEKVRLLGMGYTREQCDAIDAARDAEKPRGRQRRS